MNCAPLIIGFVVLQVHRRIPLSWVMEMVILAACCGPYMVSKTQCADASTQTDCDEVVKVERPSYYPMVATGLGGLALLKIFLSNNIDVL